MFRSLLVAFACCLVLEAVAAPVPLTVKDIGLMLRTGYSSASVVQELEKTRFADTLDPVKETQLIQAGASPDLLIALKSNRFVASPEEVAQAKQQKEAEAKRRAAAAEEALKFNTLQEAKVGQERAADSMREQVDQQVVYRQVKGDLVQWHNGSVGQFDDTALQNKKYFLIYFSAHWCGPCRKFTPGLVNYYNEVIAKHPEVELVFYSCDKSPFGMETYMRETNMPWPAIDYQKLAQKDGIKKYAGKGIPDLILVDSSGKILADSYNGDKYLGPESVLQAVNTLLTKDPAKQIAQASP